MAEPLALAPPFALLLVAAVCAALLPRRAGATAGVALAAGAAAVVLLAPDGTHLSGRLLGFPVTVYALDPLSRTVAAVLAFAAGAGVAFAYGTGASRRQVALVLAYLGAGTGAVVAGDWLVLVGWWELMALGATALLWTGDTASRRAGLRYAVYHEVGGLLLLGGVLWRYADAGTFALGGFEGPAAALAGLGIGLNVAVLGLHPWLVDAYPRPHVAASVALAACTTKVGVYALARAFPDGSTLLAYVGGAMLLVGVTYAILQTDTRRLLSYHVVSQVGFMVAGVGIGSGLGRAGAAAHLVNNVLYKSLLFAVAGVLLVRGGAASLKKLGGLAGSMPRTFAAYAVAALAIAGFPGTNGFVSKAMVIDAADAAGLEALWWALVVGSVGTAVSFLKFGYYAFFAESHGTEPTGEAGPASTLALVALAVPCLVFGLAPGLQFGVLPGDPSAAKPFATSQFTKAGAVLGAGVVAFALLKRPLSGVSGAPDLDAVYHPTGAWLLRATTAATGRVAGALDAVGARAATVAMAVGSDPEPVRERLPGWVRDDGVGVGVALVVLTTAALLVALLL